LAIATSFARSTARGAQFGFRISRFCFRFNRAFCAAMTIASSVATFSGRESAAGGTTRLQHKLRFLRA
jgi:hypothetical protein